MDEYYHAWNCVFMGLPKPFDKFIKYHSNLKYSWENLNENDLRKIHLHQDYINNFNLFKKTGAPFKQFENFRYEGIKAVSINSRFYPSQLREIGTHFSPLILYIKGNIPSVKKYFLGIVGTRDMTDYGQMTTKQIVRQLAPDDFVVVSGLARGVDTNAHKSALECGIPTVAVLGYGLKRLPSYLANITEQIIEAGALVSEYPPNLSGQKHHFPLRNRIISGLSRAVVIIEGGEKSGALITAKRALEQNREIFAVPGKIFDEKSKGPNKLIAESGAHPLVKPERIYELLKIPKTNQKQIIRHFSPELQLIIKHLKAQNLSKNELMHKILMPVAKLSANLTELELADLVERNKAGKYFLKLKY